MALTNKLSNIATAIREKTGTTELMTLDEMPEKIAGIQGGGSGGECTKHHIPDEALVISGNCQYKFANGGWNWFLEECGSEITTKDITNAESMFYYSYINNIPFDINLKNTSNVNCAYTFQNTYISKAPYIVGKPSGLNSCFNSCSRLTEIPEDWADRIDWSIIHGTNGRLAGLFYNCYSLRRIPQNLMSNLWGTTTSYYSTFYSMGFYTCYVLDEALNVPVHKATLTSGAFSNFVTNCDRLKDLTFETNEDGTPQIANWKNQTINLEYVGAAGSVSHITNYSKYHGITEATRATDDASYQALKDNPDYWTYNVAYSRYNHDSAVRTINSLPDASAYLAEKGGTNTIKFEGAAGSKTDGGAINTLTPEEISIAAAKGWTVTLV